LYLILFQQTRNGFNGGGHFSSAAFQEFELSSLNMS
jgi:hypothetical protein